MTVESKVGSARKAMAEIGDYTQEQVDNLVYAAAKIIYDNAELLAEEAVAETRYPQYITLMALWEENGINISALTSKIGRASCRERV